VLAVGAIWLGSFILSPHCAWAESVEQGRDYLRQAAHFYKEEEYFKAARYAFAAVEEDPSLRGDAYAWTTLGLMHAGLPNLASYFFIRTLQLGNHSAIRSVLTQTEDLVSVVGADLLRKYLVRHTAYADYDEANRSAYLYALGKDTLLAGDSAKAIEYLRNIHSSSPLWPFALQLRASAHAILGQNFDAIRDFRGCVADSSEILGRHNRHFLHIENAKREADDLKARCIAGEARTLYQMEKFEEADRVYDRISKASFVWPDILFEQAWNSFGRGEYNRSLGRLVSYKSPALDFVFNTEIEVLRAQSFLALCLYSDADQVLKEFDKKYTGLGEEVKDFVERHSDNLPEFYHQGKKALKSSLYGANAFGHVMNRFVRSAYFQSLVFNENQIKNEHKKVWHLDRSQKGVSHQLGRGFPGFLDEILHWRGRTIQLLGGAFVKNSLMDYHAAMIEDYEKMSFIRLEMLKDAKDKLMGLKSSEDGQSGSASRARGQLEPARRDDQYRWSFNGEFWFDELGDYVFGLESACRG
jgi:hypothetical protein